jgi:hypothetical protein
MRMIRLHECGLTSPKDRLRSILNVRAIAMKRELRDRDLKFDERIAARNEADLAWIAADRAYHSKQSQDTISRKDEAYFTAVLRVEAAKQRRIKRITMLQRDLALVKATLKSWNTQPHCHLEGV